MDVIYMIFPDRKRELSTGTHSTLPWYRYLDGGIDRWWVISKCTYTLIVGAVSCIKVNRSEMLRCECDRPYFWAGAVWPRRCADVTIVTTRPPAARPRRLSWLTYFASYFLGFRPERWPAPARPAPPPDPRRSVRGDHRGSDQAISEIMWPVTRPE